jgi:Sigma 54 modulation/S30EA ribosomal protein C terminus
MISPVPAGGADVGPGRERSAAPETVVELRGGVAADLADYARTKLAGVLVHTGRPVLRSRIRVIRHADPARELPVAAQVDLDLGGRFVGVRVEAATPREAVDRLIDRLDRRLERVARHWEARRGRMDHQEGNCGNAHEWRHGSLPTRRAESYPRPPQEREVIAHTTISPERCTVDAAVAEMQDLGQEFHLFVESSRGVDSIVYRTGPTGVGFAQVDGRAELVTTGAVPVTADTVPAPLLDVDGAAERLGLSGQTFLFYLDGDRARGCVLHLRRDGHYGLIEPWADERPSDEWSPESSP